MENRGGKLKPGVRKDSLLDSYFWIWRNMKTWVSTSQNCPSGDFWRNKKMQTAGWWQLKGYLFSPRTLGKIPQFDWYFSNGLVQPPTSSALVCFQGLFSAWWKHTLSFRHDWWWFPSFWRITEISFESKGWTPEKFQWKHGSSIAMEKNLPFLDPFFRVFWVRGIRA